MKSSVVKRSIVVAGHKTSVSLEDAFWAGLKEIAKSHARTLSEIVADIDSGRRQGNLSSAIRVFILEHMRAQKLSIANPIAADMVAQRVAPGRAGTDRPGDMSA
jgi:predicted DNA-binding ribbon-helix-helix protein